MNASPLPYRREPRPIVVDVDRCRAAVKAALPPDWAKWGAQPELAVALDEARAKWLSGSAITSSPLADGIVSVSVVWTALSSAYQVEGPGATDTLQSNVAPLVDLWVAERGLAHALTALAAATFLVQTLNPSTIVRSERGNAPSRQSCRWRRLREHVAAADEPRYKAARTHAEQLRDEGDPITRLLTSFIFPWEATWAHADAKLGVYERHALIGTALDAETCAVILRETIYADSGVMYADGRFATMALILGDDVEKPLLAMMHGGSNDQSVPATMLARFATPSAAKEMRAMLGRPEAEIARAYFRRHPALALEVLLDARGHDARALVASAVARDHVAACALVKKTRTPARKKLLIALGATERWVGKAPPTRVAHAAAPWKEVSTWLAAGAPWEGRGALAVIGDPEKLLRFAKAAAPDALPIAMAAVDVLAQKKDAVKWLARLADDAVRVEVAEHCRARLADLQDERHFTDGDVEDLAAPSLAGGKLGFVQRKLVARLDDDLAPVLFESTGERVDTVPIARSAWATFRTETLKEGKAQARRMETEMLDGRTVPDEIFRGTLVTHPVLGALARRLVWRDSRGALFRVIEDGTFAGVDDAPLEVHAPFQIAHPASLGDDDRARWSDLFASYKILQPFRQL